MKRALVLSVVVSSLAVSALAQDVEEVVTIPSPGGDVVGTLVTPEGEPAPVALLLHGFTGARDELATDAVGEGVFARTAARLASAGYASLRIDFRGSGESLADLTFADTTFEGQVADGLAALDFLKGSAEVDGEDIFIVGWSQGGLVATAVAGRSGTPDAVALWNAVASPKETFEGILGAEIMAAGKDAAPGDVVPATLPWGAEIELKGAFFDGIETFDAPAELSGYAGPLLVAQGTNDTTVLPVSADKLIAAHGGENELWLAEMDHVFNIFETDETLETMIGKTIEFFDANGD
ncbi:MAG: alpha/beta fold hydrolase [Pseudomonadota bacterium]